MSDVAIRVEALAKRYRIGRRRDRPTTLRDYFAGYVARRLKRGRGAEVADHIWALEDVSFDVACGETVGIIGRNGAGKSTLLKILTQITRPTHGRAEVWGRVGSLLEVGTGFHPELTGRENVFFYGAILGMSAREVRRKFDEIVAFSGVERFIDTPVKRYSSGMQVRLAFSVAAHLEPEIVIVDEVLAVGDVAFQKRCIDKMTSIAQNGQTILFVSHNMAAIRNLCRRAIWLHDGRVRSDGNKDEIVESYLKESLASQTNYDLTEQIRNAGRSSWMRLDDIRVSQLGKPTSLVFNGEMFDVEIHYTVLQPVTGLRIGFDIYDDDLNMLVRSYHDEHDDEISQLVPGQYTSKVTVPEHLLAPRSYELRIHAAIHDGEWCLGEGIAVPLSVEVSNGLNRAYGHVASPARLQPRLYWNTARAREPIAK
jgi:lipopolysaccharide transport system ATP-binding protein